MHQIQHTTCRALALTVALLSAACGGGGSGGGGNSSNPPGNPPPDTGALPSSIGIISVAPGDGEVQVRWDARDAAGVGQAVALFRSTTQGTLFSGAPAVTGTGASATVVGGLTNGTRQFFGLALVQGGSFTSIGATFDATPRAPIHVDDSSTAASPDGATPATAFPTLAQGVLSAVTAGGGNVWVAEGTYTGIALTLPAEVSVFGGFGADFVLAERDAATRTTLLRGGAATAALELSGGTGIATLDGLTIEGGAATFGVDVDSTDTRLASVVVRGAASHGVRLRDTSASTSVDVEIAACWFKDCGGNGLSLEGTFELEISGSRFSGNTREGAALGPLRARAAVPATLRVRDSVFAVNGEDGLDVKLGAPLVLGGTSSYRVTVDGSRFEENGWNGGGTTPTGARIDLDFDLVSGWSADVVLRGSTARDNRGDGFYLDLDATSSTLVHRVLATGNAGDGLRVTSETTTGIAVVSASVFSGNLGAGLRAGGGNMPITASHCVLAGNGGGGMVSATVTSLASSTVAWLQPSPWSGARQHFVVAASDVLAPIFDAAPVSYRRGSAFGAGLLTLTDAVGLALGDTLEIADDGVARTISGFGTANQVELDPSPVAVEVPASVSRQGGSSVAESYVLAGGSAASAAGMPSPSGDVDAGPLGAPLGGAPGTEPSIRATLFRVARVSPATTTTLGVSTALTVTFAGGTLDGASIVNQVRVRDGAGNLLAVGASLSGVDLVVTAPGGGWPSGNVTLELHAGIASTGGDGLVAPVALPFVRP